MADVAGNLFDWSTTAASNNPAGSTNIGAGLDDNLRELQKVVRQDLAHKGADIASATTTDLGAVVGLMHDITGTTTITGFGTVSAGIWKLVKFEGALTLTHNATSLILPNAANITTADGDTALAMSEGSGNWRVLFYAGKNARFSTINTSGAGTIGGSLSAASDFGIPSTNKIYLDGVSLNGDTYISEASANAMQLVAGGGIGLIALATGGGVQTTQKLYFDGGGDTYAVESAGNTLDFYAGGVKTLTLASSVGTFPGGAILSSTAGDTALNRSKEGTIASTASGPFANTATTLSVSRVGNMVTITFPAVRVAGNSTATTIALTTLAAEYRPVTSVYSIVPLVTDNGSDQSAPGIMNVSTAGVITIYKNVALASFTSSASTTGYYGFSATWEIA
jgi:hypothetical protein